MFAARLIHGPVHIMSKSLTHEIAHKAWNLIQEIEKLGGMAKAIETGIPKMRIEEAAARKQARIDSYKDTIVGVNKYRLEKEDPIETLEVDNTAVRESQIARLKKLRAERNESEVIGCPECDHKSLRNQRMGTCLSWP